MEIDVAVLGGGPGGYTAAIRAAQLGVRVACVERAPKLGGTCLRIGCIPTKAWVQTAFALKQAEETFDKLGVRLDGSHLEFAKANAWKAAVVQQMTQGVAFLFKANGVEWVKGTGTFKDANTIAVEGGEDVIFKSAIIATGSFPLRPPIEGLESNRCVDSEGLLAQTEIPRRFVILGGGVIGCEFASIFQRFGSEVTIIEMLPSLDDRKSYAKPLQVGDVMVGEAVARVIASHHPDYSEGDIVLAHTGWRTHVLSDGAGLRKLDPGGPPVTTRLGVLGMPGFTAYSGLRVIGKPQPGGREKCAFVKNELSFDAAIDHRTTDFPAQLAGACPDGIDVYFENVGGAIWQAVLPLLNKFARVPISGLIAQYNGVGPGDGTDRLPATMREILSKSLTLRGFINYDFAEQHYAEFLREVGAGIADGRIRYREEIVDHLEKAPEAFIGMLDGHNFGKVIVRVAA